MTTNEALTNLRAARGAYHAAMDAALTGAGYAQARAALLSLRHAERDLRIANRKAA